MDRSLIHAARRRAGSGQGTRKLRGQRKRARRWPARSCRGYVALIASAGRNST